MESPGSFGGLGSINGSSSVSWRLPIAVARQMLAELNRKSPADQPHLRTELAQFLGGDDRSRSWSAQFFRSCATRFERLTCLTVAQQSGEWASILNI